MPRLIVSVHDVAPASEGASREWVEELDRRGVPATLLAIPGPWRGRSLTEAPDFAAWLKECESRGHEIALHGWDHTASLHAPAARAFIGRVVARGCAEFWSLDEDAAAQRARHGRETLVAMGLHPVGFTPPGWLASRAAVRGLRRAGMRYVTSHTLVTDLRTGRRVRAPALCHRPAGRGEHTAARLMARGPVRLARSGRDVRVALHPDDLERPGLRRAALIGIDATIAAGAQPVTYVGLLQPQSCVGPETAFAGTDATWLEPESLARLGSGG